MIKTILVDDEVHCLNTLRMLLEEHCPDVQILEQCSAAEAALEAISRRKPDLVFLDIEMPFLNGFELLERLVDIPFAVIFTTSYDQYAIKAIHISALDYLLKPIDVKELKSAVQKVQSQKQLPSTDQFQLLLQQVQHRGGEFSKVAVPTVDGFELITADHVLRCEADNSYTNFILKSKNRIVASRSLKEVEMQLQHFPFFLRIHHSYIVNLNEVSRYVRGEGGYVIMSDGSTVNVSRSRKDSLLKWFT